MQVTQPQLFNARVNAYNYKTSNNIESRPISSVQFTGAPPIKPQGFLGKKYDGLTEWIAENYYKKFYNSKFAKSFIEHTRGKAWDNMTTHMSALGSTLISSMYIIRTLQNDNLDKEKRKTLAINDFLTWGLSTFGAYFADGKLANWWDGVTTRFAANYLLDDKNAKRVRTLGDWDPKDLKLMMSDWGKLVNARIDKINERISSPDYKGGRKLLNHVEEKTYKSVRDFNLDVLKNRKLTTLIDGMGVLKSLFVFGMIYRYVVPVLVMKPANMIGNYIHKKNAQKAQEKQIIAEQKLKEQQVNENTQQVKA